MPASKKKPASVSFEDFTEVTLGAVGRQLAEFKDQDHPLFKNPHITMGIIWRPDFADISELERLIKK